MNRIKDFCHPEPVEGGIVGKSGGRRITAIGEEERGNIEIYWIGDHEKNMEPFPKQKIRPQSGKLSGEDGNVSLEIFLSPFELELEDHSERVETSIRLDGIDIPASTAALEGKAFTFPVNPEAGYIDGSVYFFAAHHPVDVTRIAFGTITGSRLPVTLSTTWVLEFENSGFRHFQTDIETEIAL